MKWLALIIVLVVALGAVTTWSPWLSEDEVFDRVRASESFAMQQEQVGRLFENTEITITRTPFGRYVTTVEGGTFVGFWHGL